jgi:transcriptional regulator with XRE-family HTH domain
LTQSGLAQASGVHRVVVADIEAGRRGGSVKSLKALAESLGVGGDDLV